MKFLHLHLKENFQVRRILCLYIILFYKFNLIYFFINLINCFSFFSYHKELETREIGRGLKNAFTNPTTILFKLESCSMIYLFLEWFR